MDSSQSDQAHHVVFANNDARLAWEIGQAVDRLVATLPIENPSRLRLIKFGPEDIKKGRYAIFLSGTVVGTPNPDIFAVPERTLTVLQSLGMRFERIDESA